jgi:ribosome-binding factor A
MDYQRSDRVGDLLLEEISRLLTKEVNDPRIGAVTLTAAKVSKDLRHAQIYFSLLGASERRKEALAGLQSAAKFIRGRVAGKLNLRFVPMLEFVYDEAGDQVQRIDELLKRVKTEN